MPDPIAPEVPESAVVPAAEPVVAPVETPAVAQPVLRGVVENDYAAQMERELAEVDSIISAKPAPEVAAAVPEPVVEPEVTPPVVEAEPVVAAVVTPPPADEPRAIERPRLKDPTDQLIAGMKLAHPDWTWAQCEGAVRGPEPEAPIVQPDPIADELTEVQAALDAHAEAGDLPTPDIRRMQKRESELLAEQAAQRLVAPLRAKEAAREEQAFESARTESAAKVEKDSPDFYKEASPLNEEAREVYANMRNPEHPEYMPGIESKKNAPEIINGRAAISLAEKIATRDGIPFDQALLIAKGKPLSAPQPVKTAAAPPPTPTPTTARKPVTAPGTATTRTTDRAPTAEEVEKQLKDETDPEKIDAILRGSYAAINGSNGRRYATA